MQHGNGGKATQQLITQIFQPAFDNPWLRQQEDTAAFDVAAGRMVVSTDAHVIHPLFFPGGNIGSLAVHGTINDIVMSGAKPLYLTASFILEEGLPIAKLQRIADAMGHAAKAAEVAIIAGDTKVVEQGKGDGVYITTSGVGVVPEGVSLSAETIQPGDKVLLSGGIGEHGIAIMAQRQNLEFLTHIQSDSASLEGLVAAIRPHHNGLRCLRDPTRGGLATTLNEWAQQAQIGFVLEESSIPIHPEVSSACELLGLDPLYVANEGKLVAICQADAVDAILESMRGHPLGQNAAVIGSVVDDKRQMVQMKTVFGGERLVDWLTGDPLPRIC
jgi:hydrogenase expression/formation protein HypE